MILKRNGSTEKLLNPCIVLYLWHQLPGANVNLFAVDLVSSLNKTHQNYANKSVALFTFVCFIANRSLV